MDRNCFGLTFRFYSYYFQIKTQPISNSFYGSIDSPSYHAYISLERHAAFQFTNAYFKETPIAIYAQEQQATTNINFAGITAYISLDAYAVMILSWTVLVSLFALIDKANHSSNGISNWWNIAISTMPYSNSQAAALEHLNSISRRVAIITASLFVFFCTTYYQTLLLSSKGLSDPLCC